MNYYNYTTNTWADEKSVLATITSDRSDTLGHIKNSSQFKIHGWVSQDTYNAAPRVLDPEGNIHVVLPSCAAFAKARGMHPDVFRRVVTGKVKTYKKWTFHSNRPRKYCQIATGTGRK